VEEARTQEENTSEIIEEFIERGDIITLKTVLIDLHPADIAEAITRIDRDNRKSVFDLLAIERAAEVLVELDTPIRQDILQELDEGKIVEIIGAMDSDDATDVIGELEEEVAERVLDAMPWQEFREVKTLLKHDEETAGGIMALEIVAVDQDRTAQEAQEVLRRKADEVEDVYNIYVLDRQGVFKGIVSLKALVLADPKAILSDIMDKEAISVQPEMDQEEVANLFHKYDLVAAPVVDEQGRLVGRITVDDVLDVLEEEASEDITMMAGITDEEIRGRSIFRISGVRLPWLLVAFIGEMVSAAVLSRFKVPLEQIATSALFIPLIMAMGGNAGIQSATVVIRGLATGEINLRDTGRRLIKETGASVLNGFVISLLLFGVAVLWLQQPKFGIILALAMIAVLFNAAFIGTMIPFLLKRVGVDPAIATGPFITTSNDVLGLVVYFGMMTLFLHWL
jgi:magnesium transporter